MTRDFVSRTTLLGCFAPCVTYVVGFAQPAAPFVPTRPHRSLTPPHPPAVSAGDPRVARTASETAGLALLASLRSSSTARASSGVLSLAPSGRSREPRALLSLTEQRQRAPPRGRERLSGRARRDRREGLEKRAGSEATRERDLGKGRPAVGWDRKGPAGRSLPGAASTAPSEAREARSKPRRVSRAKRGERSRAAGGFLAGRSSRVRVRDDNNS